VLSKQQCPRQAVDRLAVVQVGLHLPLERLVAEILQREARPLDLPDRGQRPRDPGLARRRRQAAHQRGGGTVHTTQEHPHGEPITPW
jgi:hypothetical protein